ncbi:MAG: hypothetical protein ACOCUH_01695, partial [Bacteriovoracia bacterium]
PSLYSFLKFALGIIIFVGCLFKNASANEPIEVELKKLNSYPEKYMGKTVRVEGETNGTSVSHNYGRAEFRFIDSNVDVIIKKGNSVYDDIIDMELEWGDSVEVVGRVGHYSNSFDSIYINAESIEDTSPLLAWYWYPGILTTIIFIIIPGLAALKEDGPEEKEDGPEEKEATEES